MKLKSLGLVTMAAMLTACASAPNMMALPKADSTYAMARSPLEVASHMDRVVDGDNSILYHQSQGGGGVALGLMGPLGMAANTAMIGSNTKDDAAKLNDKIHLQPRLVFAEVAAKEGLGLSDTISDSRLTPYLYLVKLESGKLLLAAATLIERDHAAGKWQSRYVYQLPLSYSFDELMNLDDAKTNELRLALASGYEKVITRFRSEDPDRLRKEPVVTFQSEFTQQRYNPPQYGTLVDENTDVIWLRSSGSVIGLPKTTVTFKRL